MLHWHYFFTFFHYVCAELTFSVGRKIINFLNLSFVFKHTCPTQLSHALKINVASKNYIMSKLNTEHTTRKAFPLSPLIEKSFPGCAHLSICSLLVYCHSLFLCKQGEFLCQTESQQLFLKWWYRKVGNRSQSFFIQGTPPPRDCSRPWGGSVPLLVSGILKKEGASSATSRLPSALIPQINSSIRALASRKLQCFNSRNVFGG